MITPPSSVITNQDGSSAFKRHNSDNTSARQNQIRLRNNSGTVMKSWQRSQSSPVGTKKCSKEEVSSLINNQSIKKSCGMIVHRALISTLCPP